MILNGKSADAPELREAVDALRAAGHCIDVRVTWEKEDARHWAAETEECETIVAAGGDGTLHEVVQGIMSRPAAARPLLGVVPLGTANDFAVGCGIPVRPREALDLCATGAPAHIDVGRANDHWFINAASCGFGADVTANTPPELKRLLGGAAYTLMGAILAITFEPAQGRLVLPDGGAHEDAVVAIIGNGRQTGGGKQFAPRALLNDGLLDILVIRKVPATALLQAARELQELGSDGEYISYRKAPWAQFSCEHPISINLDGEPFSFDRVRYEVEPAALRLIVPADCPEIAPRQLE